MASRKEEEFALEVLSTILQTGNPNKVLTEVIERLNKGGQTKWAEKFAYVKQIYDETTPVEAFYRADLISDDTYRYLSIVASKGGLTTTFVKGVLEDLRERAGIMKEVMGILAMPLFYVFMASATGVQLGGSFMNMLVQMAKGKELPAIFAFHLFALKHPFLAFVLLFLGSTALVVGGAYLAIRKSGYKEMKLFQLASIVEVLRRQQVPYSEIFAFVASLEKDARFRDLYEMISLEARKLSALEAISPLFDLLPTTTSLVFSSYIERGEEVAGWHYLKTEMKNSFRTKVAVIKNVLPIFGFLFVAIIILLAVAPMIVAIKMISQLLSSF